ncbi:MAG: glutamine synthetase [Actinomycetota bacterium]
MSELEYERLRLLWPDHLGLARGKYIRSSDADRTAGFCVTTLAMSYDRDLVPAPGAHLLTGLKDVDATLDASTLRPSWEDHHSGLRHTGLGRTGVGMVDLTIDGQPCDISARETLRKAIADWAELGYSAKVGIELEAYLLEPDEASGPHAWKRFENPRSMVYGTGPLGDPTGLLDEIWWTADRCGFNLESMNIEFDESQVELTLEYDDALQAVDDAFMFRVMARELAIIHGLDLTFLGRPFPELSGSGVHVNFSLTDAAGNNALDGAGTPHGITPLGLECLGGLVTHHKALTAMCAPTINAYRRLQPASLSGVWANWGVDHRNVTNRIPAHAGPGMRIESRLGDGSMNLHLGVAAVLQAARLGVVGEVDPGEPVTTDGFEDGGTTDERCATSLGEALDDLEADTALAAAVGQPIVDNFVFNKRAEVERFDGDIASEELTDFERRMYLPYH